MPGIEGNIGAACAVHPDRPALQPCNRCGTFACEECFSQSPPEESLCAACMAREAESRLPWDYREELGIVRAFYRSLGAILLRPTETFSTARPEGDVGGSLLFAAIANFMGFITTGVLFASLGAFMPVPEEGMGALPFRAIMMGSYGIMILLAPLMGLIATLIIAAFDHLAMMLFGKPRSFEATLRGAALAQATLIVGLIPFCGLYISPFWMLVTKIFAYKGLHRSTTGVAVAGALVVPVVSIVAFCCIYGLIFSFILAGASAAK